MIIAGLTHKEAVAKVYKEMWTNSIFIGISCLLIYAINTYLHWRVFALILAGIIAVTSCLSAITAVNSFVLGITSLILAYIEKRRMEFVSITEKWWLILGSVFRMIETSIAAICLFQLYKMFFK